jgi:peptidoglycan/xylan/chitin deacetylase (PgdA/CDA1 family)
MFLLLATATFGLSGVIAQNSLGNSNPLEFPQGNGVVSPNPSFTARYDLSNIPNDPVATPSESVGPVICTGLDSTCSWGCGGCTRPSDMITCQSQQHWAVTYDDGPSEFTDVVLDNLEQSQSKATFFVTGMQVQLNPDVLRRAYRQGHQIGSHTWSHRALTSLSTEVVLAELEWTSLAIENVIGVRPKYFRPPFGDIDDRVRAIASAMGMIPVIWSFDSRDFQNATDIEPRTADLANAWRVANSGVISLQHDLYARQVVYSLPLIERVLAAGMSIVTVAACLGDSNPYIGVPPIPNKPEPPTQNNNQNGSSAATVSILTIIAFIL